LIAYLPIETRRDKIPFRIEKYKFQEEGTEWRWPSASASVAAAANEHAGMNVEPKTDNAASVNEAAAIPEAKQGEEEAHAAASAAADASSAGAGAQKRAAAAAQDCVIMSGCELKAGAVVECAYDNEDEDKEIEWICGTGKTAMCCDVLTLLSTAICSPPRSQNATCHSQA
jgi:hypothetical protein